jgi:tetratricopeptide (TPR) repeat protein
LNKVELHIVFIITAFIFLGQFSFGQNSLYQDISLEKADSTRLNAFSQLAADYIGKNNDSSHYYIQKGLEICNSIESNSGVTKDTTLQSHCGQHYMVIGYFHYRKSEFSEALRAFKKAEKIFDWCLIKVPSSYKQQPSAYKYSTIYELKDNRGSPIYKVILFSKIQVETSPVIPTFNRVGYKKMKLIKAE